MNAYEIAGLCVAIAVISFIAGGTMCKELSNWMINENREDAERWRCLSYLFFIGETEFLSRDKEDSDMEVEYVVSCEPADNYVAFMKTGSDPEEAIDAVREYIHWDDRRKETT